MSRRRPEEASWRMATASLEKGLESPPTARTRYSMYSAVSSGEAAPSCTRVWMRLSSERLRRSASRSREFGQADEDDGEEGFAVPVVVGEDVQVVEHVLVKQVGFVEEEDGVDAGGAELVDVLADLVEELPPPWHAGSGPAPGRAGDRSRGGRAWRCGSR
jgi:hypothetical protein